MTEKHRRSQQQERRLARRSGGRVQPASGATPWRKHDVRADEYLIEAKYTDKGSYTIKDKDWETLRRNALLDGRKPMLAIELGKRRLLVIEEDL